MTRNDGLLLTTVVLGVYAVGLQALLVLGTALWWGPLMARLSTAEGGLAEDLFPPLTRTHWIRVGIVTAYGALSVWMLTQNAWRSS
ncbi:MAG: hypothetical protein ACREPM_00070 [Gemmatimonadaceae bacterium]